MTFFSNFLRDLPVYLLSLPVLLMAFSVHESAHGLMAYKLGDPTAHDLHDRGARRLGKAGSHPAAQFPQSEA